MLAELGRRIFGYDGAPGGVRAQRLRRWYRQWESWYATRVRYQLLGAGPGVRISKGTRILPRAVSIGAYTFVGEGCWIMTQARIGNYCMLASHVGIVGGDHRFDVVGAPSIRAGRDEQKPVVIEDDVWLGYGAIVMHGVRIGEGAIVAAGALVTRDVEPYTIVGSPPAREIRKRFVDPADIERHRQSLAALRDKEL